MQWREFRSHVAYLGDSNLELIKTAFERGKAAHEGQKRNSGEPYFTHPIAVAMMLADLNADTETIIAALLHDTVEDTDLTLDVIEAEFGKPVATIIDGVTKHYAEELADMPSLDEKIETIRKLFINMEDDIRVMVIKIIDRLHNMQTIEFVPKEKQRRYAQETCDVYVKISDRLGMQRVEDQLEDLCLAVLEPKRQTELRKLRIKDEKLANKAIKSIKEKLTYANSKVPMEFNPEPKPWKKLGVQLDNGDVYIPGISYYVISIVCPSIQECYEAMGILHQLWQREHLSFRDYINTPMINGYRGLHTTMIMDDGSRVRCKIRTQEMDEYGQKGVTTRCFDSEAKGLLDYMPWTKWVGEITSDSPESSADFWQSLQSDILGDSIFVYGSGDQPKLIPMGSTVLDAAIHVYGKKALRTDRFTVDGHQARPQDVIPSGVTIGIKEVNYLTADVSWLDLVSTSHSANFIRQALAEMPRKKKITTGKQMLQTVFDEEGKGYIDEFKAKDFASSLETMKLSSLNDLFVKIAEGHLTPHGVMRSLFKPKKAKRLRNYRLKFKYPGDEEDALDKIQSMIKRQQIPVSDLCVINDSKNPETEIQITMSISKSQLNPIKSSLQGSGVTNFTILPKGWWLRFAAGIVVLITIWGLDPVVAYWLLNEYPIGSINLTLVRFWTLTVFSSAILAWQFWKTPLKQRIISLKNPRLWLTATVMVGIAITTYEALQTTLPSHYTIIMTSAGLTLTTIVNRHRPILMSVCWALVVVSAVLLIGQTPEWSRYAIGMTIATIVLFSIFSVISEQHKRQELIGARIGQYFLGLTGICSLLTIPLIPFANFANLPLLAIADMIGFSIVFAGMPYFIYYYLLSHQQIDFVLRFSFLLIISTVVGQWIFIGTQHAYLIMLAAAVVTVAAVLPLLVKEKIS